LEKVSVQQRNELLQLINAVKRRLVQLDSMEVILTPLLLRESYDNYFNDQQIPITDEEHTLVCALVLDMPNLNQAVEYNILVRLNDYLSSMAHYFATQLLFQLHIPNEPVKYIYEESTVCPPKNTDSCPICLNDLKWRDAYRIGCGHHFCVKCIDTTIKQVTNTQRCPCPMCRAPVEKMYYYDMQKYSNNSNLTPIG
jgi:hypothetical protein